ncbi:MAG TPA: hypothetical protein VGM37_10045 [Armatimonadota bacterium]|jgi:hypothetical protein
MNETRPWWSSLGHGGLLIAPSRLTDDYNLPECIDPLPQWQAEQLRRRVALRDAATTDTERTAYTSDLVKTVLETACGLKTNGWRKSDAGASLAKRSRTGESVRPNHLYVGPHGASLPVFTDKERRLGVGRGRRVLARTLEWLRADGRKLALVTNGRQWRLVFAGMDYDAWAEWDTDLWFEEGALTLQVDALRVLLSAATLTPRAEGQDAPLLRAILDSRKGEAELSSELGERVRQAVEHLIRERGGDLEKLENVGHDVIYRAAVRVVMRLVVLLFAEARDLLPGDNEIYYQSYSLAGLREQLDRVGSETMRDRVSAWPRVLSLFGLVYGGSPHQALTVPAYGGGLFRPGDAAADDPLSRAVAVFESPASPPKDAAVKRILDLLGSTRVKVRQGGGNTWVTAPVDFSDLSSEYIGILYEGLLDFELRRADETVVFLSLGDQPALPLSRLRAMEDRDLKALVASVKVKSGLAATAEEDGEDEEEGEEEAEAGEEEAPDVVALSDDMAVLDDDIRLREHDLAVDWARRAVKAGGLVSKPAGMKPEALAKHEADVDSAARGLIANLVVEGDWYLVRWGGTRKGAGTFYTRPQLAVPTVHRTLAPLACDSPAEGGEDAPPALWKPKTPQEVLSLKVCDPAMGSGSFLVASLRYLTDTLFASLLSHRWLVDTSDGYAVGAAAGKGEDWFVECVGDMPLDASEVEAHVCARLKRLVVERCLHGVDIDPLAVELARLSLWVETMDRDLPFEFLDHKLKAGNSLVGAWFSRFRDYPLMAWDRDGGSAEATKAIKAVRNETIKPKMVDAITHQISLFGWSDQALDPEFVHKAAMKHLKAIWEVSIGQPDEREKRLKAWLDSDAYQNAKAALDTWCAVWFWPVDDLEAAPDPLRFGAPDETTRAMVATLSAHLRFFHWELEFPDVFGPAGGGFDAMLGNPPWEIQKPNSKEFFSNVDPLYRTYGKQEALQRQRGYGDRVWADWCAYQDRLKALANFLNNAHAPFGDPDGPGARFSLANGNAGKALHSTWRGKRSARPRWGVAEIPYQYQGSADINTYKLFLEMAHALLKRDGQMGFIVPSGLYSDKGSTSLRRLFLDHCRWIWLFGFENRDGIFDIDSRFKFCPVIVRKGGCTGAVRAAFMRRDVRDWEEAERYALLYSREQAVRFSPSTLSLLEVRSERDRQVLETIYTSGVLLGDESPDGWGIQYAREFDMTNDSKLFPPRAQWEARGYEPDEYGRWIGPDGDVALPLYQGVMINQFDFAAAAYVSGAGNRAEWKSLPFDRKFISSQFLMDLETYSESDGAVRGLKVAFRDIARNTDQRTMISGLVPDMPCGNVLGVLETSSSRVFALVACLCSFAFDWAARLRVGGTHLNKYVIWELPLYPPTAESRPITRWSAGLGLPWAGAAPDWLRLAEAAPGLRCRPWFLNWAVTQHERLRLRCALDAVIAELYGLSWEDLVWILRDCDHPVTRATNTAFTRDLAAKGFWRVDKEKRPELRHTVLTQVAFADLKDEIARHGGDRDAGIAAFCAANDGDGWLLPETLRLCDYGLGHDDRAAVPQPVASALGPRFLPWQLEQTPEESWPECEHHARNILGEAGFEMLMAELRGETPAAPTPGATDLFGTPVPTDLFGNEIDTRKRR